MVGVGGAGCRMINGMLERRLAGVSFIAIDTDPEEISSCQAENRLLLEFAPSTKKKIVRIHAQAEDVIMAFEQRAQEIEQWLNEADLVVVAVGLGGITGSAAAPKVAQLANQSGALTLGLVVTPFVFEGERRNITAQKGLSQITEWVDAMIQHSCQELLRWIDQKISLQEAFLFVDELACLSVQAFTDLIFGSNLLCFDFVDLRKIFNYGGRAFMSVGVDDSEDRSRLAVRKAIDNLERPSLLKNARGAVVNITAGENLALAEANEALHEIIRVLRPGTDLAYGVLIDPGLQENLRVSLIVI